MSITAPSWLLAATGARRKALRVPSSPWRRAAIALRTPLGLGLVGALVGLCLLLAFRQTVASSVERADQLRKASLAQRNGAWRCNLLPKSDERALCQVQVMAAQDRPK